MQFDKVPFHHKAKLMIRACEAKLNVLTGHTIQLVPQVLENDLESEMNQFVAEACVMLNLRYAMLVSRTRKHEIVAARFCIAVGLLNMYQKATYKLIAKCLGYKDHTSVMYAVETVANMIDTENKLYQEYYNKLQLLIKSNREWQLK